jgi:hypothetical protein
MNKRADARRDAYGVTERSDARAGKRFGAKTYFFMNNLDKGVSELTSTEERRRQWAWLFPWATIFYTELTKHSPLVTRLYVCSRLPGCSWRDLEKPRGGSRGVLTRSLSGR